MKNILILLILLFSNAALAQTITINAVVKDADGIPIPEARYYFVKNKAGQKRTNAKGELSIAYQKGSLDSLKVEHVGFEDYTIFITPRMEKKAKDNTIELAIVLPDRFLKLFTVTPNTPDTLFGTQDYSVEDFEFLPNGKMLLLTYDKQLSKGSVLRLLDADKKIVAKHYIDFEVLELKSDFRGNIHLIAKDAVYRIEANRNWLNLSKIEKEYYNRYIEPVIDTIADNIYYSNYSEVYPAFEYFEFNKSDSAYSKILKVEDAELMEFYLAEFKYVDVRTKLWAHNKQYETGIDKEIWVGATVFANSIYYEPPYAPLFKIGSDSLAVFDHYKNLMFIYRPEYGFTDSVRISYHKESRKSGWEQPLIQDKKSNKIYGVFERNGYTFLSQIDMKTGLIVKSFRLYYKYVEHIQVIDDIIYYVYRPFESVQKKYIYQEKLIF
jgi:hypothetical protein